MKNVFLRLIHRQFMVSSDTFDHSMFTFWFINSIFAVWILLECDRINFVFKIYSLQLELNPSSAWQFHRTIIVLPNHEYNERTHSFLAPHHKSWFLEVPATQSKRVEKKNNKTEKKNTFIRCCQPISFWLCLVLDCRTSVVRRTSYTNSSPLLLILFIHILYAFAEEFVNVFNFLFRNKEKNKSSADFSWCSHFFFC